MGISEEVKKAITLLSFLQMHIQNNVKASFNDLSFQIETLVQELLNILDNTNYINVNGLSFNYPAIDLFDNTTGIAIQVTVNADMKKVKKTVSVYQNNQKIPYKHLIVIGFVKKTTCKTQLAQVETLDFLIHKIKGSTRSKVEEINSIIEKEVPLQLLIPYSDKDCLETVLRVIDRSAIKDLSDCEGNFDDMIQALKEIKQIIVIGSIENKRITTKPLFSYDINIRKELEEIESLVSEIISIVNRQKNQQQSNNYFLCLPLSDKNKIDELKYQIADHANSLASRNNIKRVIRVRKT